MKLLKTLLISGTASLLASCAGTGIPKKPAIEIGVIDYPRSEVIVNNTAKMSVSEVNVASTTVRSVANGIIGSRSSKRQPLSTYHKAIAFRPAYWEAIQNYIDELVAYAKNGCR